MKTEKIVEALRASAERAEADADDYARRFANAPAGSGAAGCEPAARGRAEAFRFQADHVEAGTWFDYLESIGRGAHGITHECNNECGISTTDVALGDDLSS